ncbi:MAG TPA: GDSL-type esterase/lipase family protein [Povalibacter sp.]|nr:GDSL-type esterase/lipase family protein [Povalibacter sp.]
MHRSVLPQTFLISLLLPCAAVFAANPPVLTPFKPGGVYALGERAGWTVSAPADAASTGEYSYTLKKNDSEIIKSGKLKLSRPSTIETSLNEPAMLYLEITGPEKDTKPVAYGAAIAPTRLQPVIPRPADFDQFWAEKIALLQKVPANPVLTKKDSGRPDVDYYILKMDHIDGRHIYGQVAKPKHAGKFPGLAMFQWASPPYPLQREWVTDRAAEGWLVVNIEPHDVLPDQPKEYYDALPKELKEYNTIERENRDRNYFLYMYLADYRAVEYLANRPDWNGTTLIANGTSMGGQQSLCVAGLNPKVTGVIVHVAAGADANGPLHGHAPSYPNWPADNPKIMETAQYFDTVNCATNIKVPSLVSMGFIDTTSTPVGIFTAFNQIRGYKEAAPMIESPHNHLATPEQMAQYTQRSSEWLRDLVAGGNVAEPANKPSRRLDENSHLGHEGLLKKKTQGQIDVYFLGDSITRRWGASDEQYKHLLANWNQNFSGWNAADFGWGGDKTQNILWRLENGELDGINPQVIVLMAGTNNVGRLTPVDDDHARIADITNGIKAIIDLARRKAPNATILLTGITPRNDNIAVMPTINAINANIAKFADGKSIRYININDKLADRSGKLLPGMTDPDQLHLAPQAYQIWADALKPHLTELLGPRAATDKAPPPTGDPSAVH